MRDSVARRSMAFICLLTIASTLALSGCTTKVLQEPGAQKSEEAVVYFIRKKYPPYLQPARLSVNGTALARIADNDYVALRVPLGVNHIAVDVIDGEDMKIDMAVTSDPMFVLLTADGYTQGPTYINTGTPVFAIVSLDFNLKAYPITKPEAERIVAGFGKELK